MTDENNRAAATRARLFAAAVAAFAERGFHGTTTRDIATTAGMSPAALYVHHSTKEELLHLIALDGHQRILDSVRTAAATSSAPSARLEAMMREFATFHARAHVHARVINYELSALSEAHLAEIVAVRNAIDHEFRSVLDAGVTADEFHISDAGITTRALTSLGIDIARWYRDEGRWTPEQIGESYANLALRLVGAQS